MKKKIIYAVSGLSFLLVLEGVSFSKERATSDLVLEDVEALTNEEPDEGETCYNTITTQSGSKVLYCQNCQYIPGTYSFISGTGTCPKK